jgi:integrase
VSRALSFGEETQTKTGRSRVVPMVPALRWDLAAWRLVSGRPAADTYVFPRPDGGAWDEGRDRRWRRFTFKPALTAAGIDSDVRVYDLRHHWASMLIKSGVTIVETARRLGHSPTVLLDTYAHVIDGAEVGLIDVQEQINEARNENGRVRRTC